MVPFKIFNDPKKLWGPLYLCKPAWWRSTCCSARHNDSDEDDDSRVDGKPFELTEQEKKMLLSGAYENPGALLANAKHCV